MIKVGDVVTAPGFTEYTAMKVEELIELPLASKKIGLPLRSKWIRAREIDGHERLLTLHVRWLAERDAVTQLGELT